MPVEKLKREVRLEEIVNLLSCTIVGSSEVIIKGVCPLDDQAENTIAFSSAKTIDGVKKVIPDLKASALIIRDSIEAGDLPLDKSYLLVPDPLKAMVGILPLFFKPLETNRSISERADVHPSAQIGKNVHIGAFCSIGEGVIVGDDVVMYPGTVIYPHASIGPRTVIHSGVSVRERCIIGADSVIQNGAVIGSDGFGYYADETGLKHVPHVGTAVLADCVDVGANTCIDRGALGKTAIDYSVKIDNLSQIGHNVSIGAQSLVCGDVAIGGSTKIGRGVTLAGASSYADHLVIDDGVRFSGRAAAGHQSHYELGDYMGYPARPVGEWRREQILIRKLPQLVKRVRALEKKVGE